jgi:hypothetical protein
LLFFLFEEASKRNLRINIDKDEPIKSRYLCIRRILRSCNYFVISTDESFLFYWLIVLNIFVLYNFWFAIARQAFEPLQRDYAHIWEIIDYLADTMYFVDIAIQFRTGYLEQGMINRLNSFFVFSRFLHSKKKVFYRTPKKGSRDV